MKLEFLEGLFQLGDLFFGIRTDAKQFLALRKQGQGDTLVFFVSHLQCGMVRRGFGLFDAFTHFLKRYPEQLRAKDRWEIVPNVRRMLEVVRGGRGEMESTTVAGGIGELERKICVRTTTELEAASKAVVPEVKPLSVKCASRKGSVIQA